jgi:hypothetical protein
VLPVLPQLSLRDYLWGEISVWSSYLYCLEKMSHLKYVVLISSSEINVNEAVISCKVHVVSNKRNRIRSRIPVAD